MISYFLGKCIFDNYTFCFLYRNFLCNKEKIKKEILTKIISLFLGIN